MVFRQLKREEYEYFTQQLIKKARKEPLDPSYTATMIINDTEYIFKIQPDRKCKVYILQALRVEREEYGHSHTLILDNHFLLALLEILIRQGVQ